MPISPTEISFTCSLKSPVPAIEAEKKGIRKLISVHYAGLRNPVTAWEVLNIGDVIRRGKLTEEGTKEHPTSRRYELETENGEKLKVIVDFSEKNDKNKSVINFYSDRKSDTGAHDVSSGIITDLTNNIPQNAENANTDLNGLERTDTDGNGVRHSVRDELDPETRAMIELFIPIIQELDMDNVENDTLAEKFNEKYAAKSGYSIDCGTALMYAVRAEDVLRKEHKERAYFRYGELNPHFGFFTEHVGSGVINPGKRFRGQDLSSAKNSSAIPFCAAPNY